MVFKKCFPILILLTYLTFFIIFQNIHYYLKSIEKLVKGHLERAVIEFDKLAAPLSPIKFNL
jgi:hypothetical protein